jgi:hypothetical protein
MRSLFAQAGKDNIRWGGRHWSASGKLAVFSVPTALERSSGEIF